MQDNTPITFDETLLTAYALGELAPGSEQHSAVEAHLDAHPEASVEVEAIRNQSVRVADALAAEAASPAAEMDAPLGLAALAGSASTVHESNQTKPLQFPRPALLAAGFAIAAGAAVVLVAIVNNMNSAPTISQTPGIDFGSGATLVYVVPEEPAQLRTSMATPVTVTFDKAPLSQVLDYVSETTGAEVTIPWDDLAARGIDRTTPISIKAEEAPLAQVLSAALQIAAARRPTPDPVVWTIEENTIALAPRSAMVEARLAQARQILARHHYTADARIFDAQLALRETPQWNLPAPPEERQRLAEAALAEMQAIETAIPQLNAQLEALQLVDTTEETTQQITTLLTAGESHFGRYCALERELRQLGLANQQSTYLNNQAIYGFGFSVGEHDEPQGVAVDPVIAALGQDHELRGLKEEGDPREEYAEQQQLQSATSNPPPISVFTQATGPVQAQEALQQLQAQSQQQAMAQLYLTESLRNPVGQQAQQQHAQQQLAQGQRIAGMVVPGRAVNLGSQITPGFAANSADRMRAVTRSQHQLGQQVDTVGTIVLGVAVEDVALDGTRLERELVLIDQVDRILSPETFDGQSFIEDNVFAANIDYDGEQHQRPEPYTGRDTYALVNDNPFYTGLLDPLSTFSVDVDTAGYALVRRQLMQQHQSPVPGAVRIEELINYFSYDYQAPAIDAGEITQGVLTQADLDTIRAHNEDFAPFATHIEVSECPWAEGHQLVRIGIKGMEVSFDERPAAHLVYLLDVSGSMSRANKLPLVVESLKLMLSQLNADDHVSIVVYAGASGLVLENASAADTRTIEAALDRLSAGGSTAGAAGIELAYETAQKHYIQGGINRVILCTDGDFNVGLSQSGELTDFIKEKANPAPGNDGTVQGVYLSVLGFGMGNLNDNMMEPLSNAGNGNYAYIDSLEEAQKVMVDQIGATLVTIAKDVKIQVEFNPEHVLAYRLIGYENRILAAEDFADDTVDAGDIGAGHTVTALYEIVPFDIDDGLGDEDTYRQVKQSIEELENAMALSASVLETAGLTAEQYDKLLGALTLMQQEHTAALAVRDRIKGNAPERRAVREGEIALRYAPVKDAQWMNDLNEMMTVNLRYKAPDAPAEQGTSELVSTTVPWTIEGPAPFDLASDDMRFASAVAGFGMVLRNSPHRGDANLAWVIDTAGDALGADAFGYRAQFIELAQQADGLIEEQAKLQAERAQRIQAQDE